MTTRSPARIRVEVGRAPLAFERWVMFAAEGRVHALIVDAQDVDGDLLRVTVVQEAGDELVLELPRPAIAGRFVKMPRESVFAEPLSLEGCVRLVLLLSAIVAGAAATFLVVWALV